MSGHCVLCSIGYSNRIVDILAKIFMSVSKCLQAYMTMDPMDSCPSYKTKILMSNKMLLQEGPILMIQ